MNKGRVGEDRGSKETDGCPLTALARVSVYSMHDLVKGRALVRIEIGNVLICHLLLLILIIFLLHEKMIPQ
jgi:hypothetical protein